MSQSSLETENSIEQGQMLCRACGFSFDVADKPVLTLRLRDADVPTRVAFFCCPRCLNLSAEPRLDKAFHLKRYENNHSWAFSDLIEAHPFLKRRERAQKKLNRRIARQMIRTVKRPSIRMLEVGCGEGTLLSEIIRRTQWQVHGVEIDTIRAKWAQSQGRPVVQAGYERTLFQENSWDLISIHEAIDHFDTIPDLLDTVRYHLTENGYLTLLNTIFDWPHEQKRDKFHHTTYYSHEGFLRMLELNGFQIRHLFPVPLPRVRRRPWRTHKCHFSKHLYVAQVKGSGHNPASDSSFWQWSNNRYRKGKR